MLKLRSFDPSRPWGITLFLNPSSYLGIRRSCPGLLSRKEFTFCADGISLARLASRLSGQAIERCSFDDTSLAPVVFNALNESGQSLAIVGSSAEVNARASRLLLQKYPNLKLAFCRDGYFSGAERNAVLEQCAMCDVVIASLGAPRQELFLVDLYDSGWRGAGFTCGGYLDQLAASGGAAYYPPLIDRLHLRWMYRIWKEPRRLWRRYAVDYPLGLILYTRDLRFGDIDT